MTPLDPQELAAPLAVTLAYLLLYYGFMIQGTRVSNRLRAEYRERGEKFDRYFGQDREMLASDRIQLNTLEHMPPFLALMWLTALFVSPDEAAIAGVIYLLARVAYPVLMGRRLGRGIRAKILIATGTGYLVLAYYFIRLTSVLVAGATT